MAGIVVTKAEWDALLQEDYVLDGIVSAVNKATPFKTKLRRKGMTAGRRRMYPVQVGMSQGQGARGENETMPDTGAEEFVDATVACVYNYGTLKVTGPSMEFSTRRAWVEFGDRQLQGCKEGLTMDIGRQCWSDGSGKLALVNLVAGYAIGTTTVIVDSAFGVPWGCLATRTTLLLRKNMSIQFGAENNGGAGYKITSLTPTTITVTPGLVGAILDNAAIYRNNSKDKEIGGWLKFVATAAFMTSVLGLSNAIYNGIDRVAYDSWEGNVINAGGVALTMDMIRNLKDMVFERAEDEESNLCINSTKIVAAYEKLLTPSQRNIPPMKLEGGYSTLEHDGLRVTKDSKAPVKCFNLANTAFIAWAQTRDPHWDDDGSGPLHRVEGQDARGALLKWYSQLDVDEPRRNGMLYDVLVT
jgi:hypothetical protein